MVEQHLLVDRLLYSVQLLLQAAAVVVGIMVLAEQPEVPAVVEQVAIRELAVEPEILQALVLVKVITAAADMTEVMRLVVEVVEPEQWVQVDKRDQVTVVPDY
jgi:hypothetical protein